MQGNDEKTTKKGQNERGESKFHHHEFMPPILRDSQRVEMWLNTLFTKQKGTKIPVTNGRESRRK